MWVIGSEGLASVSLDIEVGFICLADLVAKVCPLRKTQTNPFLNPIPSTKPLPGLKDVAYLFALRS